MIHLPIKDRKWGLLLTGIGLVFCLLVVINVLRVSKTVITGVHYRPNPSNFYISHRIPGNRIDKFEENKTSSKDTIPAGSFLLAINDKKIEDKDNPIDDYPLSDTAKNLVLKIDIAGAGAAEYEVKRKSLHNNSFMPLIQGVQIFMTEPGSTAERAGIKPGDVLYKINDVDVTENLEALKLLRSKSSGKIIKYTIIREGQLYIFNLQLASYGIRFSYFSALLLAIVFFVFGFYLSIKRPGLIASRLIAIILFLIGLILGAGFTLDPPNIDLFAIIRLLAHNSAVLLTIPVIFHSLHYFPEEKPSMPGRGKIIKALYVLSFISVVLLIIGFILEKTTFLWWLINAFMVVSFVIMFIYWIIARRKSDKNINKMQAPVVISYFISLLFLIVPNIVLFFDLPLGKAINIIIFEYNFAPIILIPASYLYVIGRYRLLDLEVRIKKNIQYTVFSFLVYLLILVTFIFVEWYVINMNISIPNIHFTGTSLEWIDTPLSANLQDSYQKVFIVIISFLITFIYIQIWRGVKGILDRMFYRVHFDYKAASAEVMKIMEKSINLGDIATELVRKLSSIIGLKRMGVLFYKDEARVAAQDYIGISDKYLNEFMELTSEELINELKEFTGSIRVDYLPEKLKSIIGSCGFNYLFPLRLKGRLVGAFLIGDKLSETSVHRQDIDFLSTICSQTATSIENALLYENLARQERIRHELDIARRIQLASLPNSTPLIEGLDISGVSIPAFEVGGDFYDYLNGTETDITIIVGDVSGKGTSAALYMSKTQGIMRTLHEYSDSPCDLFIRTNKMLYKFLEKGAFISAIGAKINCLERKIKLARAGHLPLIFYKGKDGSFTKITPKGIVLGLASEEVFTRNIEEIELGYEEGDILIFVTDGVLEARNNYEEEFGFERLIDISRELINHSSNEIRDQIVNSVKQFSLNREQFDDLTIVVVKFGKNYSINAN